MTRGVLKVTKLPRRKRWALCLEDGVGGRIQPLAYFLGPVELEMFVHCAFPTEHPVETDLEFDRRREELYEGEQEQLAEDMAATKEEQEGDGQA